MSSANGALNQAKSDLDLTKPSVAPAVMELMAQRDKRKIGPKAALSLLLRKSLATEAAQTRRNVMKRRRWSELSAEWAHEIIS